MYAEMKYAIGTIWYTGVVVPAQKPDSAVAAKCIEHVVTGSSDAAKLAGILPGSINDRCPLLSDNENTLTIHLGFEGAEAENQLIWTREQTSRDPAFMNSKCEQGHCNLSYTDAVQSVEHEQEQNS